MEKLTEVGSERAVLAGIVSYGFKAFVEVDELLSPDSFTDDSNQIIYKCLQHFFITTESEHAKPDVSSLYASAKAIGHGGYFDSADEKKYLRSLFNFPVNFESVRKLAGRLKKLELARDLNHELHLAQKNLIEITGDEPLTKILSIAEGPILEFGARLASDDEEGASAIGDGLDEFLEHLYENPRECVGVSTGFTIFDDAIGGGLRRSSVNIIGARPKIGKTTFGINVGLNIAAGLDIPVFYFDMEMDKEDFWVKMLANISGVDISKIERGKLTDEEKEKVNDAKEALKGLNFYYVGIAGKSFEETLALAKRIIYKKVGRNPETGLVNDCVMIYDYFRLNNSESVTHNIQEYQALGFQIINLKNFAKKLNIPILSFIQLNRDGINREDTDVASGSDRVIWLCNNFSIFKPKAEEENAEDIAMGRKPATRKLVPIIARHGGGLAEGDYINIFFEGQFAKMTEGKTKSQLGKQKSGFVVNDTDTKPKGKSKGKAKADESDDVVKF